MSNDFSPPLAVELFDNRPEFGPAIDRFHYARPLIGELRAEMRNGADVEEALQRKLDLAEGNEHLQRQLIATRYYIQSVIETCGRTWWERAHGVTNHTTLLNKIERWRRQNGQRVLLVTFNYDLFLEWACADSVGQVFEDFGDYVENEGPFTLIKLHGSVNWGRITQLPATMTPDEAMERSGTLQESSDFLRLDVGVSAGRLAVPAIAIPTRSKLSFQCPSYHVDVLEASLPHVDRMLVVGWRAAEERFLERCKERLPIGVGGMVISGSTDESMHTVERFHAATRQGLTATQIEGFSAFVAMDDAVEAALEPGSWTARPAWMA